MLLLLVAGNVSGRADQRFHFSDRSEADAEADAEAEATKNLYKCTRISLTRTAMACIPETGAEVEGDSTHTHTHIYA